MRYALLVGASLAFFVVMIFGVMVPVWEECRSQGYSKLYCWRVAASK